MAEATLKDVIKTLQTDRQVMSAENMQQTQRLDVVASEVASLNKIFTKWFLQLKASQGDKLEAEREKSKVRSAVGNASQNKDAGEGIGSLLSLPGILAGLGAVGGALSGLRGWEVKALKNLDTLRDALRAMIPTSLIDAIKGKFVNFRASLLRLFGLSPELKFFGQTDDITLKTPIITQIADKFRDLRSQFLLKYFGIGLDGKATTKITGPGKVLLAIEDGFKAIIDPIRALANGMTDFVKGSGSKIMEFMEPFTKGAKTFGSLFAKILKPLGFLFSAYDGVTAFMESDKDGLIARLGDGIGAFIGDFIGAPFDLLKAGIEWITVNWLGVSEDSNFMKKLSSFSFEETIGSIVSGIFGMVQGAVDWVKLLFTDPTAALTAAWEGYIGVWKGIGNWIYDTAVQPAWNFISDTFTIDLTKLPKLDIMEPVMNWIDDLAKSITSILPDISALANRAKAIYNEYAPSWAQVDIKPTETTPQIVEEEKKSKPGPRQAGFKPPTTQPKDITPKGQQQQAPIIIQDNSQKSQGGSTTNSWATTIDMVTNPDFSPFATSGL